ncbi:MAG TPA: Imm5 family immunity protein [Streptosporangiaceae bacterium]
MLPGISSYDPMRWTATINSGGELPLPARQRLYESIAGSGAQAEAFMSSLSLLCAQRAWPTWLAVFPGESAPMSLADLAVSEQLAPGRSAALTRGLWEVRGYLDDKYSLGEKAFTAIYAGFACWAVARDIAAGQRRNAEPVSEIELEPDDWEPCFFAPLATAGGALWEADVDNRARREFWHWFLASAVPLAAESVS